MTWLCSEMPIIFKGKEGTTGKLKKQKKQQQTKTNTVWSIRIRSYMYSYKKIWIPSLHL